MKRQLTEERVEERTVCEACRLVPLSHLAFDIVPPVVGWEAMLAGRGIEVVVDDLGRRAVPRRVLGELIAERDAAEATRVAERERLREEAGRKSRPPLRGLPGVEGASALAVMVGFDRR